MYKLSTFWVWGALLVSVMSESYAESTDYFESDAPTRFDNVQNPQLPPQNTTPEPQPSLSVRGFEPIDFVESPELGVLRSDVNAILATHLERNNGRFTVAALNAVTMELTTYYRDRGFILARVIIPEQSATNGIIRLRMIPGILHSVEISGESSYNSDTLTVPFSNQIGEPVVRSSLENALIQLSDYPGIELTTALAPGPEPGTTQVNVRVVEEKPAAATVVLDNYGSEDTGRYRFSLAGEYRNPTNHADLLSASVRTSLFAADSVAAQIDYRLPLPNLRLSGPAILWQDTDIGLGYSFSRFSVKGDFEALDLNGNSQKFYLRTTRKLQYDRQRRLTADVTLAKSLSEVNQSTSVLSEDNLTSLSAGARWEGTDAFLGGGRTVLTASLTQGLGRFLGGISGSGDPDSSRDGVSGDSAGGVYTVLNANGERLQSYGGQYVLVKGALQLSNDLLTSSEQIGFGGHETVRGYPESSFSADSAIVMNVEYFGLSESSGISLPISNIKLAAFWDTAWGWRNDAFANEDATPSAMSVGAYTSLNVLTDYEAQLGLGIPVGSNLPDDGSRYRVLFSFGRTF